MIRGVEIVVVPHKEQRYNTAGDYFMRQDLLVIRVSDTGNWVFNMAIAIHELVEAVICHSTGVSLKKVDSFDIKYEKARPEGNLEEPGDDPRAPYHIAHGFASAAERIVIAATRKNWKKYTDKVNSL